MDCIFCKIIAGEIPSDIVYQDEEVVAFRDINPLAPSCRSPLIGHMVNVANQLARKEGIAEKGYRLVMNCGEQGGQLVPHLHMHLLGGRKLSDGMG